MTGHSRLAPSSAFRWVPCPLSVALSEEFPALKQDPSGPEGTAAHEVWNWMLDGLVPDVGTLTSERIPVTIEMIDGAWQFVDKIKSIVDPYQAMHKARFEQSLTMHGIHPLMHGTPDADLDLLEECGEYHIGDYKFGHRSVSPFENWQCTGYTFGAFERLGLSPSQIDNSKVFFHIVQPRCFHNRPASGTWETTGRDLRRLWDKMRRSADEAITLETAATPNMGPHCRDCPGRRACPTFRRNAGANIDWVNWSKPVQMDTESAGIELSYVTAALEQLKSYKDALEQQVEFELQQGGFSPHWSMQPTAGRGRDWTIDNETLFAMGDALEIDLRQPAQPITPSQAMSNREFKKKGFDSELIAEYSKPKPGSVALKPKTDTLASRVFGAKKNGMA
ncbi:hypothetical protein D3C77_49120 [compost metagenome]